MRVGVKLLVVACLLAPPCALADYTTTTTETSTIATAATTTAATTAAAGTTVAATTTTTLATAVRRDLDEGCAVTGTAALIEPGKQPLVLGPSAQAPPIAEVAVGSLAYPADGGILEAGTATSTAAGCASGTTTLAAVSLFGGAVVADSVSVAFPGSADASGLEVNGTPVTVRADVTLPVGDWGRLSLLQRRQVVPGRTSAGAGRPVRRVRIGGLALELTAPHGGLPAGTLLLVGFGEAPLPVPIPAPAPLPRKVSPKPVLPRVHARAKPHRPHHPRHRQRKSHPLKVTPLLGSGPYVFPVSGPVEFGDTYGAPRADVGWHHGDDIFAPIGAPVVAVADGTLNRVGWERLGGWRLWVRDRRGNQFYYAHLAGYTPLALRGKRPRVRRGEVLGFVGNTGDAFTTLPHLHFEIHPRPLLHLRYDGAVNPTTYIDAWSHPKVSAVPRPLHPRLPRGVVRAEARYVFHELLVARGLVRPPAHRVPRPKAPPGPVDAPAVPPVLAAAAAPRQSGGWGAGIVLAVLVPALLLASAAAAVLLRARTQATRGTSRNRTAWLRNLRNPSFRRWRSGGSNGRTPS